MTFRREFDLTGDPTNHKEEYSILSDKQNRQANRLTMVDLNLENVLLTSFRDWNKIPSNVHLCLFHALSKYENTIGSHAEALHRFVTTN